jgi:hypothetical protein
MKVIRRKERSQKGSNGFDYVYYLVDEGNQEKEIGRSYWSSVAIMLGASNEYEKGLRDLLKALGMDDIERESK